MWPKEEANAKINYNMVIVCIVNVAELGYTKDQNTNEKNRFSNETSISVVNTTGNTDTLSLAGKNEMTYNFSEKWAGSWVVGAISSEADGNKESERYYTDLRADYSISERWYAYGLETGFKTSSLDLTIGLGSVPVWGTGF